MSGLPRVYDTPISVSIVEGEIVLLGPNGIAGSFTPAAALQSAHLILKAVARLRERGDNPPSDRPA